MRNWLFTAFLPLFLFSCTEEQKPSGLLPEVHIFQPTGITRTSAQLSGQVLAAGDVIISTCEFVYAPVGEDAKETKLPAISTGNRVETSISGLKAGQNYNCRLVVSNQISSVSSETIEFATYPNELPQLTDVELIGLGPVSAALKCSLTDDGGLTSRVGFVFVEEITGKEHDSVAQLSADGIFTVRKTDLQPETAYTVYAYAVNELGRTTSQVLELETSNSVFLSQPGMLADALEGEGKYVLSTLTVAGFLNGTDIRLLRDLMGRDYSGQVTPGRLKELNLFDAVITAGGLSYMESRYTADNTLGYGMFKDCTNLAALVLPATLEVIERNALEGCTSLSAIQLPGTLTAFAPSAGCGALREISVSPQNTVFSSDGGVLYNKLQTELVYYPQGRVAGSFTLPATVRSIGDYAFQYCPVAAISMPAGVEKLGSYAFYHSRLERVAVSDAVTTISYAAFQNCDALQRVTLGASVTLLSEYCFDGCSSLAALHIRADYPPVRHALAFTSGTIYQQCTLHVPVGCRTLYRYSTSWKDFLRIVEE